MMAPVPGTPSVVAFPDRGATMTKDPRPARRFSFLRRPRPPELDKTALLNALRAYRRGDFAVRLPGDWAGADGEIAEAFNDVVALSESLTREVTRVSETVGRQGDIRERAELPGAGGAWAASIKAVNTLIGDLVQPVSEVSRVIGAVAKGHLSRTMQLEIDGRPLRGEFLRIGQVVNTMVEQLAAFAAEVTRVAREVGTEGKLGGQAEVQGVAGIWKDLTDNVNSMAANLTSQVRNIAEVTTAVANGDLSKKITVDVNGEILELKSTINTMVDQLNSFASEVSRVAREVGTDGKLGGQAEVQGVGGVWQVLTDNVNFMAANLTSQVRNIAEVTTAVANGDLSRKITVDVKGEILELKSTINTMVDQLNSFAAEVTRVAREVGTEGKLGGQAEVKGVGGTWKDLTDNVNSMAANLTGQVRNIAEVTTAVATGDLSKKITVNVKGEILELKSTINTMVDQLNAFASEVTRVAREVGTEGKLGGQARVPGAAGLWRDLTDGVNQLAANLTTQVRAIAEVATAVTEGDLTRSIAVEASGEVAALKDNINEMIRNLRVTTEKNTEQDWLKTNLARLTRMLQGERDLVTVSRMILSQLAPLMNSQHAVLYTRNLQEPEPTLELVASYGFQERKGLASRFRLGEGLVGQCAYERERILLSEVPGDYIRIRSGLGSAPPLNIIVLPILFEREVKGVIELASFSRFNETHLSFLDQLSESIGVVLNSIEASMRTEALLKQSQSLTGELQSQQEELRKTNEQLEQQAENLRKSEELLKRQQEEVQHTNAELHAQAELLSEQKAQVERSNREIALAKQALEEKAEQLAISSQYKSEFLANMSHELRTPLNSLLILARLLEENPQRNLSEEQVEFAQIINSSGQELLKLINDILDLAKIESGTVTLDIDETPFADIGDDLERTFRQVAEEKGLSFSIEVAADLPSTITTDGKRLQQVLKNLLANAFKFTERGEVGLRIAPAGGDWRPRHPRLDGAGGVVAFAVRDTGIGIPQDKQQLIFGAFQQADGTTSRHFGGTGLGLSISREIAQLLGGEIAVASAPGEGSTFTFYLPLHHRGTLAPARPAGRPPRQASGKGGGAAEDTAAAAPAGKPAPRPGKRATPATGVQLRGKRVLLVDDDPRNVYAMTRILEQEGIEVTVARSGRDAIECLSLEPGLDLVFMDIMMPDMDGYDTMRRIRSIDRFQTKPIIALTAKAMKGDREKCLAAGATEYISKPLDVDRLMAVLHAGLQC